MNDPVRESVKQVDEDHWLIGPLQLCRSKGYSDTSTWYDQDDDFSYTLNNASDPPPPTVPLSENIPLRLVHDVGSAVWSIGNSAFCKVKIPVFGTTPEAATLAFIHEQQPDFEIPKVLHQAEQNGRFYLFLSRVRGQTLENAWSTLDEKWRQHYMNAVVNICKFLQSRESDILCGADGKNAFEPFLVKYGEKEDFSPQNLQQGCEIMGMDCSKLVFGHADLAPGNIMVEDIPETGSIGIIDWEVAGFFPRGWIRTKFRVNGGLDLPDSVTDTPTEWRSGVQKSLEAHGFEDYSSQWASWWFPRPDS